MGIFFFFQAKLVLYTCNSSDQLPRHALGLRLDYLLVSNHQMFPRSDCSELLEALGSFPDVFP